MTQTNEQMCEHGVNSKYCFNCKFKVSYGMNVEMFNDHHYVRLKDVNKSFDSLLSKQREEWVKMVENLRVDMANEETLQHKYPKLNKNHSKYQREVELVKGYNWAIDRMRIVVEEKLDDLLKLL